MHPFPTLLPMMGGVQCTLLDVQLSTMNNITEQQGLLLPSAVPRIPSHAARYALPHMTIKPGSMITLLTNLLSKLLGR